MSANESVFPQPERTTRHANGSVTFESFKVPRGGLTKRELFAAMAMQAVISSDWWRPSGPDDTKTVVQSALLCADALLSALQKDPEG